MRRVRRERSSGWRGRRSPPAPSRRSWGCPARPGLGGGRRPGSTRPSRVWARVTSVARTSGCGIWSGRSTIWPKKTPSYKSEAPRRQRPIVKFAFIRDHRFPFAVTTRCQGLQVSRSGSDAWAARPPRAPARRRQDRLARRRTVYAEAAGRYGSPQITAVLQGAGDRITGKTVARLRRQAGLRARVTRRYQAPTSSGHGWPVADNVLARPCTATQPHATWMADITRGTPCKLPGGIQPGSQEDRGPGGSR